MASIRSIRCGSRSAGEETRVAAPVMADPGDALHAERTKQRKDVARQLLLLVTVQRRVVQPCPRRSGAITRKRDVSAGMTFLHTHQFCGQP